MFRGVWWNEHPGNADGNVNWFSISRKQLDYLILMCVCKCMFYCRMIAWKWNFKKQYDQCFSARNVILGSFKVMTMLWKVVGNNTGLTLLLSSHWMEYFVIIKHDFWKFVRSLEQAHTAIPSMEAQCQIIKLSIQQVIFTYKKNKQNIPKYGQRRII